ncbi:DUF4177 domain-containing protein [Celeribacter arenosi]|uniref:DUF4177 domain-containing protein n=1 Tax=Celeribacter arenosi TaxID=792649 RepID=A0ABP7JVJ4_9RHOB
MPLYEYKTVPASKKGEKAKGVKSPEGRIAQAMETTLNAQAKDGWEYIRADLLPMEERAGLTSRTTNYYTVLVFRREIEQAIKPVAQDAIAEPVDETIDESVEPLEAETTDVEPVTEPSEAEAPKPRPLIAAKRD